MTARVTVRQIQRTVSRSGLDYYPTPPWGTRALFEEYLRVEPGATAWDPACGQGHMASVMREYFGSVDASDAQDLGFGRVEDFLTSERESDWIVTNPPFNLVTEFAERAMTLARTGVAMLARLQFLEGRGRWERLFSRTHWHCAPFSERIGFNPGKWDPTRDRGVTAHAWFVWRRDATTSTLSWLPPHCKTKYTRDVDDAWSDKL